VVITWRVDARGNASRPAVDHAATSLADRDILACIAARVGTWAFPPATRGAVVRQEWRIAPARYE
jgi:hypothetical protein